MLGLVDARRAAWKADYDAIAAVVPEWRALATPDAWAWARAIVASRNFAIKVDGVRVTDVLVPLAGACVRERRWADGLYPGTPLPRHGCGRARVGSNCMHVSPCV